LRETERGNLEAGRLQLDYICSYPFNCIRRRKHYNNNSSSHCFWQKKKIKIKIEKSITPRVQGTHSSQWRESRIKRLGCIRSKCRDEEFFYLATLNPDDWLKASLTSERV
jgi:hypothetical protein